MFKPSLRIPRRSVLGARPSCASVSASASASRNLPSPFAAAANAAPAKQQRRAIHASPARSRHNVAPLTEDGSFEKNGVPGLLSPEAFDAAYTNYQGWVLDKLNSLTEGTCGPGSSPRLPSPPPRCIWCKDFTSRLVNPIQSLNCAQLHHDMTVKVSRTAE